MALFDLVLYYTADESGEDMNGVSVEEVKTFLLNSDKFLNLHALTIHKHGNDDKMMKVSIMNAPTRSGSRISFWQIATAIASNNMVYKTSVFNREDVYDRFKNAFIGGVGGRRRRATRKRVLRKRSTRRSNIRS